MGERLINCGNTGNYMQLFLRVSDHRIADIRYLCSCEPAANVAVEGLSTLVKGKTLDEAATLTEESFFQRVGSREEPFAQKVQGILALFHEALTRCRNSGNEQGEDRKEGLADGQLTWDRSYSALSWESFSQPGNPRGWGHRSSSCPGERQPSFSGSSMRPPPRGWRG